MAKKKLTCLTCQNKPQSRGLCWSCLSAAKAAMRTGQATEAELIAKGLLLKSKRAGRPATTGFAAKFAKVK